MNYQTTLMQKILTNEKAQEIIDYVSQIYGDSYVGLWLFQAIGTVLGPAESLSEQLMYETSPATTTLLIDYWENAYGIQGDPTMTLEQRRARVVAAISSKGACNPARLANEISAVLGGAPVEILENTGKNEFTVNIRQVVRSYAPAIAVIEKMKPAHLIYELRGVTQESITSNTYVASAMTLAQMYKLGETNAQTVLLIPILQNDTLLIKRKAGTTETIEQVPHTDDGQGNVTLTTLKATYDGQGNVTLPTITIN